MLGHLMEWFFSGLGGISQQTESVGFKRVKIKPQMPVGINSVSTSMCHLTVIFLAVGYANLIKSGCMYKSFTNSEAIVYLPAKTAEEITESGIPLKNVDECRILERPGENYIVVSVGSGNYIFEM